MTGGRLHLKIIFHEVPLSGGHQPHGQGMKALCAFLVEQLHHPALATDPVHALKLFADED